MAKFEDLVVRNFSGCFGFFVSMPYADSVNETTLNHSRIVLILRIYLPLFNSFFLVSPGKSSGRFTLTRLGHD